jgi:hypothetical protein
MAAEDAMNPTRNQIPASHLQPGTVLRTQSSIFPVMHWGVVGNGIGADGLPRVWHSQKSDVLRCTDFQEFSPSLSFQVLSYPLHVQHGRLIVQRLQSKQGLPWHPTKANCEMVARWAVENKPISDQLGLAVLVGVVAVVALLSKTD